MKARQILVPIIMLFVGGLIGGLGAFAYSGKMAGEALLLIKTLELRKSADSAHEAYKAEDPRVGVWALAQHLKLIDELNEVGYHPRSELNTHAIITHARLAKLHDALNLPKKASEHAREAIALAEASGQKAFENVTSEDTLWKLLEKFDAHDIP